MTYTRSDISEYARRVQLDLNDCQKKLSRLMEMVMSLPIPQEPNANACEKCGVVPRGKTMAHHLLDVHGIEVKAA